MFNIIGNDLRTLLSYLSEWFDELNIIYMNLLWESVSLCCTVANQITGR